MTNIKIVEFKSELKYYLAEEKNLKPNTERTFLIETDPRKIILDEFIEGKVTDLFIIITCSEFPEDQFMREVSHVAIWQKLYIISWHKGKDKLPRWSTMED